MSLEFFMGLLVVLGGLFVLGWIFCEVEDFRREMIRKARGRDAAWTAAACEVVRHAKVRTGVEARLPPMAPAGRYGMKYGFDPTTATDNPELDLPADPPAGWDKGVSRSKAGRQEE